MIVVRTVPEATLPAASRETFCQRRGRWITPSGPATPELINGTLGFAHSNAFDVESDITIERRIV
jgi:hypothetical protein